MIKRKNKIYKNGFSLIEIIVAITIIGILATISMFYFTSVRKSSRDTKRKVDISQIGRMLSLGCYLPVAGDGDYDLTDIILEIKASNPGYAKFLTKPIKDPSIGTDTESFYKYIVVDNGRHCALYANLENDAEDVTLSTITTATPDGKNGVYAGGPVGWNGTNKYVQFSK